MDEIKFWVAAWGAITGSLALCIQLVNYWRDRAIIKLTAKLSWCVDLNHREGRLVFTIDIVNHGRRSIYIESAQIELPVGDNVPAGTWGHRNTMTVYPEGQPLIQLQEGHKKTIGIDPFPVEFANHLGNRAWCFVKDTTGKEFRTQFYVTKPPPKPQDVAQAISNP